MAWVRIDDHFPDHPKVLSVGPAAAWLHVCALCYCGRYLTDGFLPTAQLRRLADVEDPHALAERLVACGLWTKVDGGWQLHDYLEYQPSAQQVRERRRKDLARKGFHKDSTRNPQGVDALHPESTRNSARTPDGVDADSTRPVPVPVPRPVPVSHPVPDPYLSVGGDAGMPEGTDGQTEVEEVFAIIQGRDRTSAAPIIAATIAAHPDTDPCDVAREFVRWQRRLAAKRAAGDQTAFTHQDPVMGWLRAMERADERGLYHRPSPFAGDPLPTEDLAIEQSGIEIWDQLRTALLDQLGGPNYGRWFGRCSATLDEEGHLIVSAPDAFHRDWLATRLESLVAQSLDAVGHPDLTISYVCTEECAS